MTTPTPVEPVDRRGGTTRRQFLGWSAAASAGLLWGGPGWALRPPIPGLGIVGLGERGRRSLAVAAALQDLSVEAVCDLDTAALAGVPETLDRFSEAGRLFSAPNVQVVILAVPATAMLALARGALAFGRSVLLTRPTPWELPFAGVELPASSRVEIVPALHYSLGPRTAGFQPELAAKSVAVELVARSRAELAALAPEAFESAGAWLGGQRMSIRVLGGPTPGGAACFGARGTVLLEHHDLGPQRMDFMFQVDPHRNAGGRMTITGQNGGLALGLWPRSSGAPNANDLAALLAGLGGSCCGLQLSTWSRGVELFRELMTEIEG